MRATERQLWRGWERALREFAKHDERVEHRRDRWDARIRTAMRGVSPEAWWRCNRRIETGERWVGPNANARRVQRVVYGTRPTVLDLVSRRDVDLTDVGEARTSAERQLRQATRQLVADVGRDRVSSAIGLSVRALAHLIDGAPIPAQAAAILRQAANR